MRCIDAHPRRAARPGCRASLASTVALALAGCHSTMPPAPARSSAPAAPAMPAPASPARPARTSDEYLRGIALRLVAANPTRTYATPVPDPVPAILCLEIEVDAAGRVRNITVARRPAFADMQDTVPIAIEAVRRAAPFGDATHVPRPWKFREYFLFDEDRRFKPRELDR